MQHNAAFHLGLHCLQKYSFRGFPYTKGKWHCITIRDSFLCRTIMDIPTRCSGVVSESGTENFLNWFSAQFDKMEKTYTTNHKHLEDENFIEVLNDVQVKDILVTEGNVTFLHP